MEKIKLVAAFRFLLGAHEYGDVVYSEVSYEKVLSPGYKEPVTFASTIYVRMRVQNGLITVSVLQPGGKEDARLTKEALDFLNAEFFDHSPASGEGDPDA